MIASSLKNRRACPSGPLWDQAFDFLCTLSPDTPSGKYPLVGEDLFVVVDRYETKPRAAAKLETHQCYIDIQVMLQGEEQQEWFDAAELTVRSPYVPEKDVEFYEIPADQTLVVTLRPGQFAVYYPEDAHMPCLMTDAAPQPVVKAVVKLSVAAIGS